MGPQACVSTWSTEHRPFDPHPFVIFVPVAFQGKRREEKDRDNHRERRRRSRSRSRRRSRSRGKKAKHLDEIWSVGSSVWRRISSVSEVTLWIQPWFFFVLFCVYAVRSCLDFVVFFSYHVFFQSFLVLRSFVSPFFCGGIIGEDSYHPHRWAEDDKSSRCGTSTNRHRDFCWPTARWRSNGHLRECIWFHGGDLCIAFWASPWLCEIHGAWCCFSSCSGAL